MAQQAAVIAAQHARSGVSRRKLKHAVKQHASLHEKLNVHADRLETLFKMWDEDGNGMISKSEFQQAVVLLDLKAPKEEVDLLFAFCDSDGSGEIEFKELMDVVSGNATAKLPNVKISRVRRLGEKFWAALGSMTVQTLLYLAFVGIFQMLTESLRMKEEFFFDKMISDTFIENHFDSSHNTFESVRRISDIYEWGNSVLWPGLFSNGGPSCENGVGQPGKFRSHAIGSTDVAAALELKGCNDDAWPDGEGSFHAVGATPWKVQELVERMNQLDWTEGIAIRQVRVNAVETEQCKTKLIGTKCYPELYAHGVLPGGDAIMQNTSNFGYNWTSPTQPLQNPFMWRDASFLGANSAGQQSAFAASFRLMPAGGFVSIVLPFFSEVFLEEEKGDYTQVADFRTYAADRTHPERQANFFCVRLSWNTEFIHQICDPNDPVTNRTTGVVRAAVEEFWNDLKRAQYIDTASRAVTITLPLESNNIGVRSRVTLLFELVSTGGILPSYDMETRVTMKLKRDATHRYVWIAFYFCCFFCLLEGIEIFSSSGVFTYFKDMWNVMDWINFSIFFLAWMTLRNMFYYEDNRNCSELCQTVGYYDDWEVMGTVRVAKIYLSLCVCIQLLKILKFTNMLVPKMGLATSVLAKALSDLVFFGIVFFITMFAFSAMFYVQLGPVMEGYNDQIASFVSLARALFGDFDINDIMNNSRGYLNACLFLMYLFVAVFIMLSMFFAILGESQAKVRDDEQEARESGSMEDEYGVFTKATRLVKKGASRLPLFGGNVKRDLHLQELKSALLAKELEETAQQEENKEKQMDTVETKVDKIGSRLEDGLRSLQEQINGLGQGTKSDQVIDALQTLLPTLAKLAEREDLLQIAAAVTQPKPPTNRRSGRPFARAGTLGSEMPLVGQADSPATTVAPATAALKAPPTQANEAMDNFHTIDALNGKPHGSPSLIQPVSTTSNRDGVDRKKNRVRKKVSEKVVASACPMAEILGSELSLSGNKLTATEGHMDC